MDKNFTYSDPEGSFTWINPVSVQREYFVPPSEHEEAIKLFEEHPDFQRLLRVYREASKPAGGATNVRDEIRSGLKRVEDAAEAIRREREAEREAKKGRGDKAPA